MSSEPGAPAVKPAIDTMGILKKAARRAGEGK